jgi:hypothetical protein
MKWTFFFLLAIGTAFGAQQTPCNIEHCPAQKASTEDCDLDLFRRNCQVFSSHLEFLYWKTVESDLIYAQKMNHPAWGPANNAVQGTYQTSNFNIDPGFRLSLSFFRAPRYWELWAAYTRLTSRGTDSISAPSSATQFLTAAWPMPLMGQLSDATSSLHLNYNVADFYIDRYFNPNPHLRIRMIAGLTGTWLNQNWTIRYFDIANNTARVKSAWDFWGCGIRFGMAGDWFWTNDIYLTVKGTLAGLMGPYHNKTFQTTTALGAGYNSTLPIRDAGYRDTRPVGNLQLIIGPSWQSNWTNARTELFVGYEFNSWLNLQEVYHSTLGTPTDFKETWINSGMIGLQGLSARFTVDY